MMPLNTNIALGIRPFQIEGPMDQATKALTLQDLIAQQQTRQMAMEEAKRKSMEAQAYRSAMGALPPGATDEDILRVARPYQGPDQIGTQITASLDRKAKLNQHLREITLRHQDKLAEIKQSAAEGRITREEAFTREAALRRELQAGMIELRKELPGIMAANRAPTQPHQLQLTTDEAGNQLVVNPDKTTSPLLREDGTGVKKPVAADRPMTEFQGKAALYGTRAAQSDKVLKSLEDKISTAGLSLGQATGVVGNTFMSSEQRRVNQAQRDFVNAVLRQESGAVISDAEFENAKKQYFPQTNDDPNTVAQKRANRQLAVQGFARMSGPKGTADIKTILDNPLLPGVGPKAVSPQESSAQRGYVEIRKTADGRTLGKKADGTIEEVKQ